MGGFQMSLVSLREILGEAKRGNYAVGYFESWDYGSLEATVKAAEETNFPIIAGFSARTFSREDGWDERRLICFAKMGKELIERSSIPIGFILNESDDPLMLKKAMEAGFNCIMFDGSHLSLEENIKLTREVVKEAKKWEADVEGQLGGIPSPGKPVRKSDLTSPEEAKIFVKKTGVTALAVSVGNVHMSSTGTSIDFELADKIKKLSHVPLVMHGGTGFPDELIAEAVKRGFYKFNLGSILKKVFLQEIKNGLSKENFEGDNLQIVHDIIDSNSEKGVFQRAYSKVKEVVKEKIKLYSLNKVK